MILPFSMMDVSEAASEDRQMEKIQKKIQKLGEKWKKLEDKINSSDDEKKIQKWKAKQEKITCEVEKLVKQNTGEEVKIQVISSENEEDASSKTYTAKSINYKRFSESGSQRGCDKNSESWSFSGVVYYNKDYFWMTTNYPSDVSEGSFPNCSNKYWKYNLNTEVENMFSFGREKCESNFTVGNYASSKFVCPRSDFTFGEVWTIKNTAEYRNGSR